MAVRTYVVGLGVPLYEILDAGGWKSPAFLKYLDTNRLEDDLVLQAHMDEETDEEG